MPFKAEDGIYITVIENDNISNWTEGISPHAEGFNADFSRFQWGRT
jgi:hypothetical protein